MKLIKLNLIFAIVSLLFYGSCNKDQADPVSKKSKSGLSLRTDANYEDYEDSLNSVYVTDPEFVIVPNIESYSITHSDGYITNAEKARINSLIADLIGNGFEPRIIDINILESKVHVCSNESITINPEFPDDIRPNGGLQYNGIIPGHWCDNSVDNEGGGCGRVATSIFWYRTLSPSIDHFTDIKEFGIVGKCDFSLYDEWDDFGLIEIETDELWHYSASCTSNGLLCMDSGDLESQGSAIHDLIEEYVPEGWMLVGHKRCAYNSQPDPPNPTNYYWYYSMLFGKPVYN